MSKTKGFRRWWLFPTLAALITVGVPLAAASETGTVHGAGVQAAATDDPMLTATKQAIGRFIKLWNENKVDELVAGHYTDDAVLVPPNHEQIRGKAKIVEYLKGARDAAGEMDPGNPMSFQAIISGNLLSLTGEYTWRSGKLRLNSHELYQRQADGSVRATVDMFGFRDPLS
ncbi:MAG: hypothetical protein QOF96_3125 [Actinomycetota bacterium]|jgi:ketosteroid isomerase-like protein|nr:hypothetical protein [Actinomycetota bacterium]